MPRLDVSCPVPLAPGSRLLPYPAGVNVRMCHNSSTLENAIDKEKIHSSCSHSLPSHLCKTRFWSFLYCLAAICLVLLASFGLQILGGLRRALWTSDYYLKYPANHWGTSTCITVHTLSKVRSAYPDSSFLLSPPAVEAVEKTLNNVPKERLIANQSDADDDSCSM